MVAPQLRQSAAGRIPDGLDAVLCPAGRAAGPGRCMRLVRGRMGGPGRGVGRAALRARVPCIMLVVCAIKRMGALCAAGRAPNRGGPRPGLRLARCGVSDVPGAAGRARECQTLRCCIRASI